MDNQFKNFAELLIFCIAGGSGTGKTSLKDKLLEKYPDLFTFSVSGTTRQKGENEIDGKDYFYFLLEVFNKMESDGLFIETNPFATGHRYGTLVSEFERAVKEKKILVVDCEINGAIAIHKKYPGVTACVFLDCSDEEAKRRLQNAGTRKRERIPERIQNLQEQRLLAENCNILSMDLDTTKMTEEFIFDICEKFLFDEIAVRKSAVISF